MDNDWPRHNLKVNQGYVEHLKVIGKGGNGKKGRVCESGETHKAGDL